MLRATRPVIAVSAIRTGCGKSQTVRWLAQYLNAKGLKPVVIRHPMPYGDLAAQAVQRFATVSDLAAADCTIEEWEDYAPHIAAGTVVFAGVDYQAILKAAEAEADVILWDGGNNDFPFLRPDLHIVVADALRAGQAARYHPGETVARMADIIVINKVDVARAEDTAAVEAEMRLLNAHAAMVRTASPVTLDDPSAVAGRRVLVVEDGPTITHGGAPYGAGYVATRALAGVEIVDPRPVAVGDIEALFRRYPHIGPVLPAVGYGPDQRGDLVRTIEAANAEVVVAGTPIDLGRLLDLATPVVRARYGLADAGQPTLAEQVDRYLADTARV